MLFTLFYTHPIFLKEAPVGSLCFMPVIAENDYFCGILIVSYR